MRAYLVDNKAQTHTIAFAIEEWWISDLNSFFPLVYSMIVNN